jgi:hypothetical protein
MSLRDYFAAKALQGICAAESENNGYGDKYMGLDGVETSRRTMYELTNGKEDYSKAQVPLKVSRTKHQQEAQEAYERANAMLAERAKFSPP